MPTWVIQQASVWEEDVLHCKPLPSYDYNERNLKESSS